MEVYEARVQGKKKGFEWSRKMANTCMQSSVLWLAQRYTKETQRSTCLRNHHDGKDKTLINKEKHSSVKTGRHGKTLREAKGIAGLHVF